MNFNLLSYVKKYLRESLEGIPHLDNPDMFNIKSHLLLRDGSTGIEYTVSDVNLSDPQNPIIRCYRYNPGDDTRFYLDINKKDFKNYELA